MLVLNRNNIMIRKTALLTATAAVLFAAPALAQDVTQDPAAAATADVAAQAETAPAQAEGSVAPGAEVRASDGATSLGILEGATTDASGQQALAVRAEDGSLKTVPMAGASLQEGAVVTAWTEAEFDAAPSVAGATADASATAPAQPTPEPAPTTDPMADPLAAPETMTAPEPATTEEPVAEPDMTDPQ